MLKEWLHWWNTSTSFKKWGPLLAALVYWFILYRLNGLRADQINGTSVMLLLYYLGPKVRPLCLFLFPLYLTSAIYDSMRFYSDYIRGPIHVREPYEFDKRFFGIEYMGKRLTPNEWWQLHTYSLLDFFTGLAYIIFVPMFLVTAAYYRFWLSRTGTPRFSPEETLHLSKQILWAFFWVNMIGYSTYYWYAASPPWYAALYGFGPARTDIPANLAGCARFDKLIGYNLFQGWYGRSADVHGAIPSLHIAYPLQTVYYAFKFGRLRVIAVSFFLLMCFSAVYLNHHYVLDILWGSVYALATCLVVDMVWSKSIKRTNPNAARISLGLSPQKFR